MSHHYDGIDGTNANENRNPEGDRISSSLAHYRAHQGINGVLNSERDNEGDCAVCGGREIHDPDCATLKRRMKDPLDVQPHLMTDSPLRVNARQVGGAHYGLKEYQHWDMVAEFQLDYFQGQITKYVMRWRDKNGVEDLEKAQHYLEKYIALEKAKHPKEPDSPARIG